MTGKLSKTSSVNPYHCAMSQHNAASNVHDLRGISKHNVSILIYAPVIAPNTHVYPTAIVSSNHEPVNQSYCHVSSKSNPEADQDKESRKKVSIYLQVNVNG